MPLSLQALPTGDEISFPCVISPLVCNMKVVENMHEAPFGNGDGSWVAATSCCAAQQSLDWLELPIHTLVII